MDQDKQNQNETKSESIPVRRPEIEAEIAVLRRIELLLADTDTCVFLTHKPGGPTTLEGVVNGKGFRHSGSAVLGLTRLLNLLDGA